MASSIDWGGFPGFVTWALELYPPFLLGPSDFADWTGICHNLHPGRAVASGHSLGTMVQNSDIDNRCCGAKTAADETKRPSAWLQPGCPMTAPVLFLCAQTLVKHHRLRQVHCHCLQRQNRNVLESSPALGEPHPGTGMLMDEPAPRKTDKRARPAPHGADTPWNTLWEGFQSGPVSAYCGNRFEPGLLTTLSAACRQLSPSVRQFIGELTHSHAPRTNPHTHTHTQINKKKLGAGRPTYKVVVNNWVV